MAELPEGFAPHFRKSPVTDPWEPLFSRRSEGGVEIGLWAGAAHCNSRGIVHGGVLAALADNAMGLSVGAVAAARGVEITGGLVTVSLTLDYIASGQAGQWIVVTPRVLKAGRGMGFADALVTADGTPISRASATFRPLA